MRDIERALHDITAIREQLTRGSEFRGFGPPTLAATGLLAFAVGAAQARWLPFPELHVLAFVALWVATAAVAVALIGSEAAYRARRAHGSLATPMLLSAVEQFLPAIVGGGLVTLVLLQARPAGIWMLPGLWQIIFSLGAFATARLLPRPMKIVGFWYLACGFLSLELGVEGRALSPWAMAVPFGVGQLLVAAILQLKSGELHGDE